MKVIISLVLVVFLAIATKCVPLTYRVLIDSDLILSKVAIEGRPAAVDEASLPLNQSSSSSSSSSSSLEAAAETSAKANSSLISLLSNSTTRRKKVVEDEDDEDDR